ncbi:OLC1v1008906C1 [Oldenlandia corymbosa var. corymbosa]|uniref:OLC1v1008906C1 n=1 Tax=Oldenlandia corymbosa var. corymbosa TaxID=529605 RepID=A0AAV1DN89_OLDCO|nr:OLC1v1008906C1 [Oldenlandia corymbosa var. corymbosa]
MDDQENPLGFPANALQTPDLNLWHHFICCNLMPTSYTAKVTYEMALLLYAIVTETPFDAASVIRDQLTRCITDPKCHLPEWESSLRGVSQSSVILTMLFSPVSYVQFYEYTVNKSKVQYARILVEMKITDTVPDRIVFEDEYGNIQVHRVVFEWMPTQCKKCQNYGHVTERCQIKSQNEVPKVVTPSSEWRKIVKGKEVRGETVDGGITKGGDTMGSSILIGQNDKEVSKKQGTVISREKGVVSVQGSRGNNDVIVTKVVVARRSPIVSPNETAKETNVVATSSIGIREEESILIDPGPDFNVAGGNEIKSEPWREICKVVLARVLVNGDWVDLYADSVASVPVGSISDHSPLVLQLEGEKQRQKKCPFRFLNMWSQSFQFLDTVKGIWDKKVDAVKMFQVCMKLRMLKKPLRKLNRTQFNDIVEVAQKKQLELGEIQNVLASDPCNVIIQEEERKLLKLRDLFSAAVEGTKWKLQKSVLYSVSSGSQWLIGGGEKDVNARTTTETYDHLAFHCQYSRTLLDLLRGWLKYRRIAAQIQFYPLKEGYGGFSRCHGRLSSFVTFVSINCTLAHSMRLVIRTGKNQDFLLGLEAQEPICSLITAAASTGVLVSIAKRNSAAS